MNGCRGQSRSRGQHFPFPMHVNKQSSTVYNRFHCKYLAYLGIWPSRRYPDQQRKKHRRTAPRTDSTLARHDAKQSTARTICRRHRVNQRSWRASCLGRPSDERATAVRAVARAGAGAACFDVSSLPGVHVFRVVCTVRLPRD